MDGIENFKYRDAFITLNEMASHQENKEKIVELMGVQIASHYLGYKDKQIKRQAVSLLGSLVSI